MQKQPFLLNRKGVMPDWMTIQEALRVANQVTTSELTDSDIYRHALYGDIFLSIYFQSPIFLRKIMISNNRLKLRSVTEAFINQLCLLERSSFLSGQNMIFRTEGKYITPIQPIIDTALAGYEHVMVQRLLSRSLDIPLPVIGASEFNYGISVTLSGEMFQIFEKVTWQKRINQQILQLRENISPNVFEGTFQQIMDHYHGKEYFPLYNLPQDACFVIRQTELEKLINMPDKNRVFSPTSTRISTPLSRMFWLACKNNETISPLIDKPYKLLSIFEQWASVEGFTDRFSGDTLKNALKRGAPSSKSLNG